MGKEAIKHTKQWHGSESAGVLDDCGVAWLPDAYEWCPPNFLGLGVVGKGEPKKPVRIVPLIKGFVVQFEDGEEDRRGFTDAFDLVEWLLDWLGFGEEVAESICDRLWDADELYQTDGGPCTWEWLGDTRSFSMKPEVSSGVFDEAIEKLMERDHANRLDVLEAAQAYVEHVETGLGFVDAYDRLSKAVKKWRGIK